MTNPRRRAAALVATATLLAGCYTSNGLVEKTRNRAIRTRIDEVELGSYRVTLPSDQKSGEMTEISVRLFGESERYKINEIEDELALRKPQVEDETLRTLRETSRAELADPDLKQLRQRLLATINAQLTDGPLKAIGFYDVQFTRH